MFNNVIRPSILGKFLNKYSKIEYDEKYLYLFIKIKKKDLVGAMQLILLELILVYLVQV